MVNSYIIKVKDKSWYRFSLFLFLVYDVDFRCFCFFLGRYLICGLEILDLRIMIL